MASIPPRGFMGRSPLRRALTRRRFLQTSVAATSGFLLSNCARNLSNPTATSTASPTPSASATDSKTLYIYTWANYTDDELLAAFTDQTGIKTVVDTYDSNEIMLAKLQAGGGSQYSIVYPSDYAVVDMVDRNLLTSLDKTRLEGLDNLLPNWQDPAYDPDNTHSIPTTWGTTGLIYNPETLGTEITGWDYLYDNVDQLTRKVSLINDVREVFGATLLYLGFSLNATDPDEIEAAYTQLLDLKPAIASFLTNGWEDQIAGGDLTFAMAYSSDALNLITENPELAYVIPESGSSIWTDTIAIPRRAPNPEAAYAWINFVLDPQNTAKLVERLQFSTPNRAAIAQLPSTLKNNPSLFPPDRILAKGDGVTPLSPEISDLYDRYWTELTSG